MIFITIKIEISEIFVILDELLHYFQSGIFNLLAVTGECQYVTLLLDVDTILEAKYLTKQRIFYFK